MIIPLKNHRKIFFKKLIRNILIGIFVIFVSLWGGMEGYRYYEGMDWVDSYVNATMILSGMGPVSEVHTTGGKIFAGSYALYSGILFLVIVALIFAPVIHYLFVKFNLRD
jgi:hypothetical protein